MDKKSDYTPASLVFSCDIGYQYSLAKNYKKATLLLKNDSNTCTPAFHLLSTIALELFVKILLACKICLKYKDEISVDQEEIRNEIRNDMIKYRHNIKDLFDALPQLKKDMQISDIKEETGPLIHEYRIIFEDGTWLPVKDVEAIRYGSFAIKKDIMTICTQDHLIIDLLERVNIYVEKEYRSVGKEIRSGIN